jgi:hypothetical protein
VDFNFFQISSQNPKLLAFGFTEKCQFEAKTDRNYIFLGREAVVSQDPLTGVDRQHESREAWSLYLSALQLT